MAKKIVAMKLDEARKAELEAMAQKQGKTVTDVLLEALGSAERTYHLEAKVTDLQSQISEVMRKYEDVTGRKMKTTYKITIPVTRTEYRQISKAAIDAGLPRGRFLRGVLAGSKTTPALMVKP